MAKKKAKWDDGRPLSGSEVYDRAEAPRTPSEQRQINAIGSKAAREALRRHLDNGDITQAFYDKRIALIDKLDEQGL